MYSKSELGIKCRTMCHPLRPDNTLNERYNTFDVEWQYTAKEKFVSVLEGYLEKAPIWFGLCYTNIRHMPIYPLIVQHELSDVEFCRILITSFKGLEGMLTLYDATSIDDESLDRLKATEIETYWYLFKNLKIQRRNDIKLVIQRISHMPLDIANVIDSFFEERPIPKAKVEEKDTVTKPPSLVVGFDST